MTKTFLTLLSLMAAATACADSTERYFSRIGRTTYVSKRCYCGHTALSGYYTGKDMDLRIAAFDCQTGLTFYASTSGPNAPFSPDLWVSNACYRWLLIAPTDRVENTKVERP
jgi:hypothetical protein